MQTKFCLQFSGDDPKQKLCAEVISQFGRKKAAVCSIFFDAFLSKYDLDPDEPQQICEQITELMAIKAYRTFSKKPQAARSTSVTQRPRSNSPSSPAAVPSRSSSRNSSRESTSSVNTKENNFQVISSLDSFSDPGNIAESEASYDQQAAFMDMFEGLFGE